MDYNAKRQDKEHEGKEEKISIILLL